MNNEWPQSRLLFLGAMIIIAIIAFAYQGISGFDFISFDDNLYIYKNDWVQEGLTLSGLKKAFTDFNVFNYHPITMLSYMIDCELFGVNPGGHHLVSLFIHMLNGVLLFVMLRFLTGNLKNSFFVAVFFSIHPMHVESVAWISERKDVISAFFGILTLISYTWYIRHNSFAGYVCCLSAFLFGLMSKVMLVTLPFVFILLDVWPLERGNELSVSQRKGWPFVREYIQQYVPEKLPFFLLSVIFCFLTIKAQDKAFAVVGDGGGLLWFKNIFLNYAAYIIKFFFPVSLSFFYPYPLIIPLWKFLCAACLLFVCSTLALKYLYKAPYLFLGWFWFLGTLVPVSGILQVGSQSIADRYTYIPFIGLFIMVVWGSEAFFIKYALRTYHNFLMGAWIFVLTMMCFQQVRYWENSETLFTHAIEVNENNHLAYTALGYEKYRQNDAEKALENYKKALDILPDEPISNYHMGCALIDQGKPLESREYLTRALKYSPENSKVYLKLGYSFSLLNDIDGAIANYNKALQFAPDIATVHFNIANCYAVKGRTTDAEEHYKKAVELDPKYVSAYYNWGNLQMNQGKLNEARGSFLHVLKIDSNHYGALNNIGLVYERLSDFPSAIQTYRKLLTITSGNADVYNNLGNTYLKNYMFNEAIEQYKKALRVNPEHRNAKANLNMVLSVLEKHGKQTKNK